MNRNKLILFAIYILISSCNTKTVMYCTEPNYTGFCFEFQDTYRFKYYEASCLESVQGRGNYQIIEDSIIFHFEDFDLEEKGGLNISRIENEDSIIINLKVVDIETDKPLIGNNAALYEEGKLLGGKSGDFNGKSEIKTRYVGKEIIAEISYVEYFPLKFSLDQAGEYEIIVKLEKGKFRVIRKQDRIYNLVKMTRDSMIIKYFEEDCKERILTRKTIKKKKKNAT